MKSLQPVTTTQLFGWTIVAEPIKLWWPKLVAHLTASTQLADWPLKIFTPNPEIVMAAQRDPAFQNIVAQADYLLPDGIGLVWAARLLRMRIKLIGPVIPERITGTDLVARLLDLALAQNWRVLVVGGRDYLVGTTSTTFSAQPAQHLAELPGQVWWSPGYRQIAAPTPTEDANVLAEINRLKPAIVLVAFGAPHQENWVITHQLELHQANVRLAITVGGALDFLLGKVARAPQAWQNFGLEWLYRLMHQPWRWRRQLDLIRFGWLTLTG